MLWVMIPNSIRMLSGSTRYFWGQKWIQISVLGVGYHVEGRKQNRRILRRIGLGALCTVLAAGGFWAGESVAAETLSRSVFREKSQESKEQGIAKK